MSKGLRRLVMVATWLCWGGLLGFGLDALLDGRWLRAALVLGLAAVVATLWVAAESRRERT